MKARTSIRRFPNRTADRHTLRKLAAFRYALRKFLRFSEQAARSFGVTPQQHQLLLGVAGFTSQNRATISQLAEFMQERHNSTVELAERAARRGLVRREHDPHDRRFVVVSLTARGEAVLAGLAKLHTQEIARLKVGLLASDEHRPRAMTVKKRR